MTAKQLRQLAGVLLAAVVLWVVVGLTHRTTGDATVGLALPKIDTAAVDTIAIVQAHDSVIVTRGAGAAWRVNGHPAAMATVQQMLAALVDTTNQSDLAAESRGSHAALGVSATTGQVVRVVASRGPGLDLIAGHNTSAYRGRYVRLARDSAVYALTGPLARAIGHALPDWRDHTILSVPPDSVRRIVLDHGRASLTVERAGTAWKLASGIAADSSAVAQWLAHFHPMSASGFATAAQADSARFAHPTARVRLYGTGEVPLADVLIDSTATHVWVRAGTGRSVYSVESWSLSDVVPPLSTLVRPSTAPTHAAAARPPATPPANTKPAKTKRPGTAR